MLEAVKLGLVVVELVILVAEQELRKEWSELVILDVVLRMDGRRNVGQDGRQNVVQEPRKVQLHERRNVEQEHQTALHDQTDEHRNVELVAQEVVLMDQLHEHLCNIKPQPRHKSGQATGNNKLS